MQSRAGVDVAGPDGGKHRLANVLCCDGATTCLRNAVNRGSGGLRKWFAELRFCHGGDCGRRPGNRTLVLLRGRSRDIARSRHSEAHALASVLAGHNAALFVLVVMWRDNAELEVRRADDTYAVDSDSVNRMML